MQITRSAAEGCLHSRVERIRVEGSGQGGLATGFSWRKVFGGEDFQTLFGGWPVRGERPFEVNPVLAGDGCGRVALCDWPIPGKTGLGDGAHRLAMPIAFDQSIDWRQGRDHGGRLGWSRAWAGVVGYIESSGNRQRGC